MTERRQVHVHGQSPPPTTTTTAVPFERRSAEQRSSIAALMKCSAAPKRKKEKKRKRRLHHTYSIARTRKSGHSPTSPLPVSFSSVSASRLRRSTRIWFRCSLRAAWFHGGYMYMLWFWRLFGNNSTYFLHAGRVRLET